MAAGLHSLPNELILQIADYLACDATFALRLSTRGLHSIIRDDEERSECARRAILDYKRSPEPPKSKSMRCLRCKQRYAASQFTSSAHAACIPPTAVRELFTLPLRFCPGHLCHLTPIVKTGLDGKNGWRSCMGKICMHCGDAWDGEHIQNTTNHTSKSGLCYVRCKSCPIVPIRLYIRFLKDGEEIKQYKFFREAAGGLRVKETYADGELTST
ncbi:hypothetical protein EJ04DRAFT_34715 [Polyplosphaeria fusca]|uniref:F-box domain-containing protein n=1 Tax=Polyplosphaeria fusca TaxID=682080 RepID=A0A9P4QTH8_9PLEO|nr:hypothetical protein EJ04DRAFT_34715 [Polyplosphaeria fusca]